MYLMGIWFEWNFGLRLPDSLPLWMFGHVALGKGEASKCKIGCSSPCGTNLFLWQLSRLLTGGVFFLRLIVLICTSNSPVSNSTYWAPIQGIKGSTSFPWVNTWGPNCNNSGHYNKRFWDALLGTAPHVSTLHHHTGDQSLRPGNEGEYAITFLNNLQGV